MLQRLNYGARRLVTVQYIKFRINSSYRWKEKYKSWKTKRITVLKLSWRSRIRSFWSVHSSNASTHQIDLHCLRNIMLNCSKTGLFSQRRYLNRLPSQTGIPKTLDVFEEISQKISKNHFGRRTVPHGHVPSVWLLVIIVWQQLCNYGAPRLVEWKIVAEIESTPLWCRQHFGTSIHWVIKDIQYCLVYLTRFKPIHF